MSCWDSNVIYSDNWDNDNYCGILLNEYPGCGSCSHCVWSNDYDRTKIAAQQQQQAEWLQNNPTRYKCNWLNKRGERGTFTFRSSSLERAREVAKISVYEWESLLIQVSND